MKSLKLFGVALTLGLSSLALAQDETKGGSDIGSAFVNENILYVTYLGDCNRPAGKLEIVPSCRADRANKNKALLCSANLEVISTVLGCPSSNKIPHVMQIDLLQSGLAPEAAVLRLNIQDRQLIEVKLK